MGPFEELKARVAECRACPLRAGCRAPVFGSGSFGRGVMLLGEAPGAKEDQGGEPFVGPSGRLLWTLMAEVGLAREDFFVTNTVKCRPPMNRTPKASEAAACRPFLEAQLDVLRPRGVVTLGALGARALLGFTGGLGPRRGRVFWPSGRSFWVLPLYHPAYLLRFSDARADGPRALTRCDLATLRDLMR